MTLRTFTLLIPAVIFLSFAIFVYFKGQNNRINRIFILFLINMALWSVSLSVFYTVKAPAAITFWAKINYLLASLIPPTFALFAYIFPDGKFKISLSKRFLLFIPSIILAVLYFSTSLIIKDAFEKNGVRGYDYGPLRFLWDLEYKGIFAFGFYRFLGLYRLHKGIIREKIKYIIIGNLYLSFLGGIPQVVLPTFKIFNFVWLGPFFSLVWLVIILFAIVKYRLVDVRIGFSNMGIFAGIYTLVLGVPILLYCLDHKLFALIFAIILATIGPLAFSRLRKMAEDRILEEEKRYQDALLQASKALRSLRDQNKIINLVSTLFFKGMKLNHLAIFIKEDDNYILKECRGGEKWKSIAVDLKVLELLKQQGTFILEELEYKMPQSVPILNDLRENSVSVVIPIVYDDNISGVIMLGEKSNNGIFSNRDIFVFNILADYTAFALQNVVHAAQ